MCRLSQISGKETYKHISSSVSSFVHFLTRHVRRTALNYTGFPGLVQVAAESECGASLHGHRKCSQVDCPLVYRTSVSRLSKVVTRVRSPLQRSREGLALCLLSRVTPPFRVAGILKPPHHDKVETPRGGITSSAFSILATNKASAFSFIVCTLPPIILTSSA